jgi:hypothetical protein
MGGILRHQVFEVFVTLIVGSTARARRGRSRGGGGRRRRSVLKVSLSPK